MTVIPIQPVLVRAKNPPQGPEPALMWLPISDLRIETEYQRAVSEAGLRNINKICRDFSWHRFSALTVAPLGHEDGRDTYAVIDGQHRATALMTLGVERAPCLVQQMSFTERAEAFVAINSVVTPVTAAQKYWAAVSAKVPDALAAQAACEAAGVVVSRYPKAKHQMKAGETLSATSLLWAIKAYGQSVLELALKLVTKTGDGHPGLLSAAVIKAAATVIGEDNRLLTRSAEVLAAAQFIDWPALVEESRELAGYERFHVILSSKLRAELLDALDLPSRSSA